MGHNVRCARLAVAHLQHRMSPGFVAQTALGSTPLRAVTQVDGLGQLGVCLYYSGHLGLAAARPMLVRHYGEDSAGGDEFDASYLDAVGVGRGAMWTVVTIPLRSLRTALGPCVVAVHPVKGSAEAGAMVAAGLARWRPDLAPEDCGGHGGAPMLELLGVGAWEKVPDVQGLRSGCGCARGKVTFSLSMPALTFSCRRRRPCRPFSWPWRGTPPRAGTLP